MSTSVHRKIGTRHVVATCAEDLCRSRTAELAGFRVAYTSSRLTWFSNASSRLKTRRTARFAAGELATMPSLPGGLSRFEQPRAPS
jgi:hypothetical protein